MMRPERDLFEIAVYRLALESWSEDVMKRLDRRREGLLRPMIERGTVDENDRVWADTLARRAEKVYGWDYNEVIAWVRLIWDGPGHVVKGYMWQVVNPDAEPGKRFHRRYQRGFKPHPFLGGMPVYKVLEVWALEEQTDVEIFQDIRESLRSIVTDEGPLRGRHIDLRVFDTVGPELRWRRLIGLSDE